MAYLLMIIIVIRETHGQPSKGGAASPLSILLSMAIRQQRKYQEILLMIIMRPYFKPFSGQTCILKCTLTPF